MSALKSKLVGLVMVLSALVFGSYYILSMISNSFLVQGENFPLSTFFGIPLLNWYWTLALPLLALIIIILFLVIWLGIAAMLSEEPRVSEEEMRKIRELDKAMRAGKQDKKD